MRKFKHKTTGEVAALHNNFYVCKDSACIPIRFIEGSCDWEEIVEKDYEILSLNTNSSFGITKSKLDIEAFEDEDCNTLNFNINSIKRLSDGEILTIGDTIADTFYSEQKISEFYIDKKLGKMCIYTSTTCRFSINTIKKPKPPILITEDKVNLFEGDSYYFVWLHNPAINQKVYTIYSEKVTPLKEGSTWSESAIFFAKKENAERHIKLNSPKYTALDMLNMANHYASYIKNFTEDKILKYLEKIN